MSRILIIDDDDILREILALTLQRVGHEVLQAGDGSLAADIIDWMAEEGRRAYGRIVPSRATNVQQMVVKEPVGPVAAFSPWNFPINQAVRKISSALAAGCSIILKAPEETPASPAELVRCFVDAGAPAGTVQVVHGEPVVGAPWVPQWRGDRAAASTVWRPARRHRSGPRCSVPRRAAEGPAGKRPRPAARQRRRARPLCRCRPRTRAPWRMSGPYRRAGPMCCR